MRDKKRKLDKLIAKNIDEYKNQKKSKIVNILNLLILKSLLKIK